MGRWFEPECSLVCLNESLPCQRDFHVRVESFGQGSCLLHPVAGYARTPIRHANASGVGKVCSRTHALRMEHCQMSLWASASRTFEQLLSGVVDNILSTPPPLPRDRRCVLAALVTTRTCVRVVAYAETAQH